MDPIELRGPDGKIYLWICGKCRHIPSIGQRLVTLTDEMCAEQATWSKRDADRCCSCEHCGVYIEYESMRDRPFVAGEPIQPTFCCDDCWQQTYLAKAKDRQSEFRIAQEAEQVKYDEALAKSKDRNAAQQMELLISDISEETSCARWLVDIEHELWMQLGGDGFEFGFGCVTDDEVAELRRLHERCGGWWTYRKFVTTEEWLLIHEQYRKHNDG